MVKDISKYLYSRDLVSVYSTVLIQSKCTVTVIFSTFATPIILKCIARGYIARLTEVQPRYTSPNDPFPILLPRCHT